MGGFFAFFGTTLGKTVLQAGITIGLDAIAALSGGGAQFGQKLKNKAYQSDAYGTAWPRGRGTTRLQGKIIYGTKIVETTHKTVSGGLFGLGSTSTYYYTYSVSIAVGFGKKLGGGAAKGFLRIQADGKALYNAQVTDAAISGDVTLIGPVSEGAEQVQIQTGAGSSFQISAGDLIHFAAQPNTDYQVQEPLTLGANSIGTLSIFPGVTADLSGGGPVTIPGLNSPLFDQSSFDDDPHDGSHFNSTPVGPGGIRFYLGSDTQQPDPTMVKKLGVGNVPGYRGLCYCMIYNLQLANYGNHVPAISAVISWEDITGKFPKIGPIDLGSTPAMNISSGDYLVIPGAYYPNPAALNPDPALVVAIKGNVPGADLTFGSVAYVVNAESNSLVTSGTIPSISSPFFGAVAADSAYLYIIHRVDALNWGLSKIKLSDLSIVALITGDPNIFEPSSGGLKIYDTFASLLGAPVLKQMAVYSGQFGSISLVDREKMVSVAHAETPSEGFSATNPIVAVDNTGDVWVAQGTNLIHYDGQFSTAVTVNPITLSPEVVLAYPTLAIKSTYDLSGAMTGPATAFFYLPDSDSFVIAQSGKVLRVDRDGSVLGVSTISSDGTSISTSSDFQGSVMLATSGGTIGAARVSTSDIGALTPTVYDYSDWFPSIIGDGSSVALYDGPTDSIWITDAGSLYRIYLDRADGQGVTVDVIVAALHSEAGYSAGQYDVSELTGYSRDGVEYDQEPRKQSIQTLMQLDVFDGVESDGKIKYVRRDHDPVLEISEDDLGASDGTAQEPRLVETLQEETEVPETVSLNYYDKSKLYQQATQNAKRISQPYASEFLDNQPVTNSRTKLLLTLPVSDSATPMKQCAEKILYDRWASRFKYTFKTGIKYIRLDPTDPITVAYKGRSLAMRLTEADRGASLALQFQAESHDPNVYLSVAHSDSGSGSGTDPGGAPTPTPTPTDQLSSLEIPLNPTEAGAFSVAI